jgi:hypothetical protein
MAKRRVMIMEMKKKKAIKDHSLPSSRYCILKVLILIKSCPKSKI